MAKNLVNPPLPRAVRKEMVFRDGVARKTLSFYRYVRIQNPRKFRDNFFTTLQDFGCLGRIYVASEGINAQMNVPEINWEKFDAYIQSLPELKDVPYKIAVEESAPSSFYKLTIKVKDKIVADGLTDELFDVTAPGEYLTAEEMNAYVDDPEAVIIDMRNGYESEIGHFEGAICPDVDTFREELAVTPEKLKIHKNKKVALYCTGGIRCEKASAWLKYNGFTDVKHLKGGIIDYAHQVKEKGLENKFKGKNFVFDERLGERISEEIIAIDENLGEMVLPFVEENEQSVRELQDQILQVRMVQVGSIFTPMKRLVRDFAIASNKQIRLGISGADTELDKTVTEQLHGPLVHLIRNAMDHGIEEPEIRQQHGKDPTGTIALRASHQEGFVIVEIEDDGKGMDPQKIMEAGVRKGLVSAGDQLSEQEAFQLIFQPGFTTTTEVTSVSGRGVGMDSVKREIEALLGNIEIHSNVGKGTLVRLKLPLTLAIIEGMIVRVGVQIFILPLLAVLEALRPRPEQIKRLKRRGELIDLRGEYIPLIRLHERLKLDGATEDPSRGLVIVIQQGSQKHCMLVDEIIDQRPVVIKNLEDHFIQVPGIAGATIMGDGSVSFILDVSTLAA